ncbi:hypothetical protein VPH35_017235 [Triticum aestivum]
MAVAGLPSPSPPRCALAASARALILIYLEEILRRGGYGQVTACTDPVAAMAELRPGHMGWPFEVVMVDVYSLRCSAPALELLECAIGEMHVDAYAISKSGHRFGPLTMEDLNVLKKFIDNEESSGSKSQETTPNGPCNSSQ